MASEIPSHCRQNSSSSSASYRVPVPPLLSVSVASSPFTLDDETMHPDIGDDLFVSGARTELGKEAQETLQDKDSNGQAENNSSGAMVLGSPDGSLRERRWKQEQLEISASPDLDHNLQTLEHQASGPLMTVVCKDAAFVCLPTPPIPCTAAHVTALPACELFQREHQPSPESACPTETDSFLHHKTLPKLSPSPAKATTLVSPDGDQRRSSESHLVGCDTSEADGGPPYSHVIREVFQGLSNPAALQSAKVSEMRDAYAARTTGEGTRPLIHPSLTVTPTRVPHVNSPVSPTSTVSFSVVEASRDASRAKEPKFLMGVRWKKGAKGHSRARSYPSPNLAAGSPGVPGIALIPPSANLSYIPHSPDASRCVSTRATGPSGYFAHLCKPFARAAIALYGYIGTFAAACWAFLSSLFGPFRAVANKDLAEVSRNDSEAAQARRALNKLKKRNSGSHGLGALPPFRSAAGFHLSFATAHLRLPTKAANRKTSSVSGVKSPHAGCRASPVNDEAYEGRFGVSMEKVGVGGGIEVEYGVAVANDGASVPFEVWAPTGPAQKSPRADVLYLLDAPSASAAARSLGSPLLADAKTNKPSHFAVSLLHAGYRVVIPQLSPLPENSRQSAQYDANSSPSGYDVPKAARYAASVLREVRRKDALEAVLKRDEHKQSGEAKAQAMIEEEQETPSARLTEAEKVKALAQGALVTSAGHKKRASVASVNTGSLGHHALHSSAFSSSGIAAGRDKPGPQPTFVVGLGRGGLVALHYPLENPSHPILGGLHARSQRHSSDCDHDFDSKTSLAYSVRAEPSRSIASRLASFFSFEPISRVRVEDEEANRRSALKSQLKLVPTVVSGIVSIGASLDSYHSEKEERHRVFSLLRGQRDCSKRLGGIGPSSYAPTVKSAVEYLLANASSVRLPVLLLHSTKESPACISGINWLYESLSSLDCTLVFSPALKHGPGEVEEAALRVGLSSEVVDWIGERVARGRVRFSSQGVWLGGASSILGSASASAVGCTSIEAEDGDAGVFHIKAQDPGFSVDLEAATSSCASIQYRARSSVSLASTNSRRSPESDATCKSTAKRAISHCASAPSEHDAAEPRESGDDEPVEELVDGDLGLPRTSSLAGLGITISTPVCAAAMPSPTRSFGQSRLFNSRTQNQQAPKHIKITQYGRSDTGYDSDPRQSFESAVTSVSQKSVTSALVSPGLTAGSAPSTPGVATPTTPLSLVDAPDTNVRKGSHGGDVGDGTGAAAERIRVDSLTELFIPVAGLNLSF